LSERKFKEYIRKSITFFLLFALGFVLAPLFALGFVLAPLFGVGILILLEKLSLTGSEHVVFGGSIILYLLLYMELWFRLRKKLLLS